MKSGDRKLAAIMFTDIVSFSNMMSIDEDLAISTLDSKVDELINENWEKALKDDFPDRKTLLDNVYKYD